MKWLVLMLIPLFFILREMIATERELNKNQKKAKDQLKSRSQDMPAKDVVEVNPAGLRKYALDGYEIGFEFAKTSGKEEDICYQVGVLEAFLSVLAGGKRDDELVFQEIQMETIPFNQMSPEIGKLAAIEYLVWKEFPTQEDSALLREALIPIKKKMISSFEDDEEVSDGLFYNIFYSGKYGWGELMMSYEDRPPESAS